MEIQQQPALRVSAPQGVLRLRAEPTERRRIQWAEDVIDNEGMGKKSSKGSLHLAYRIGAFANMAYSLLYLPQASRSRRIVGRRLLRRFFLRIRLRF
jgi:hypothetical protein